MFCHSASHVDNNVSQRLAACVCSKQLFFIQILYHSNLSVLTNPFPLIKKIYVEWSDSLFLSISLSLFFPLPVLPTVYNAVLEFQNTLFTIFSRNFNSIYHRHILPGSSKLRLILYQSNLSLHLNPLPNKVT